jgi:hypothetical protein
MNLLYIIIAAFILLGIVSLVWKGGRVYEDDVSAMKAKMTKQVTGVCPSPEAFSFCFVDKMLAKYGFNRTYQLIQKDQDPRTDEQAFAAGLFDECGCSKSSPKK